jgi:pimeloyl-ACP methyl ester carboxylesterase
LAHIKELKQFDGTDRIGGIRCPTLIVAGDEDAGSVAGSKPLESADTLHRLIPGSILEVIMGANHYPHIDHPEISNTKTVHFLTGPGTAARTPAGRGVT